jgi:hypothetical protein
MAIHHAENAAALLRAGRSITVRVSTGSMAPTLAPGDEVRVEPLAGPSAIRIGAVVLVDEPAVGELILHRLIARLPVVAPTRYVHRGDAPNAVPYLCRAEQIIGVAAVPARRVGRIDAGTALLRLVARFVRRSKTR